MSTRKELKRSPLHRPAFRRLWLGLVISRLGDQFTIIALVWFVFVGKTINSPLLTHKISS
jgi:hypothetical protein